MAGGAQAGLQGMFAGLFEPELRVEGSDAVYLVFGDAQPAGHGLDGLRRDVALSGLYLLEDRYDDACKVVESWEAGILKEAEHQSQRRCPACRSPHLELLDDHKGSLEQLRPGLAWEYAATREEVFKSLKGSPHVVYFYCHGGLQRDAPYLQVGSPQNPGRILPSNLTAYKIAWENPRPLVFLNGCHTTAVQPLQALDFVSRFVAKCNCAGVIGTEITIFEQLATVFAQECLRRFFAGQSIGEAVRGARLKLLNEGNPLGLVYIPFVLGGLKLVSQPGG